MAVLMETAGLGPHPAQQRATENQRARGGWNMLAPKRGISIGIALGAVLLSTGSLVRAESGKGQPVGVSAARPGIRLVGPVRSDTNAVGVGGGSRFRRDLSSGEGVGPGWCGAHSGYILGASYQNVYACGPANGPADDFDTAGFQCVELSERFMWAIYKEFVPDVPDGKDLVSLGGQYLGTPIGAPGPGSLPVPGDIVSLWGDANADPFGHTAVVTGVNVDSQGNGTIQIMEENGASSGWDQINVTNWAETYGDPSYDGGLFYYDHIDWLELAPSAPTPPKYTLRYSVNALGVGTVATGINSLGTVTGTIKSRSTSANRPFLYHSGKLSVLSGKAQAQSTAQPAAINDNGSIAASVSEVGGLHAGYAIRTRRPASWSRLPKPGPNVLSEKTTGIDSRGDISGWMSNKLAGTPTSGLVWLHINGTYQPRVLTANRGFASPVVVATDRWHDSIGSERSGTSKTFAVVWASWGKAYRLPSLNRFAPLSMATSMTVRSAPGRQILTVAGWSRDFQGILQACEWKVTVASASVQMRRPALLGTPTGYANSRGLAINSSGWVAGDMTRRGTAGRGFLSRPGISMSDIDSILQKASSRWVILSVAGMNANGQIIAQGYNRASSTQRQVRALLLDPVETAVRAPGHPPTVARR